MEKLEYKQVNSDTLRPFIPKGTHPVETGKYLISTNEIDRMYQTVLQWIENRMPGAIIYGRPRLGKTRAITYLMNCLPQDFGKTCQFIMFVVVDINNLMRILSSKICYSLSVIQVLYKVRQM